MLASFPLCFGLFSLSSWQWGGNCSLIILFPCVPKMFLLVHAFASSQSSISSTLNRGRGEALYAGFMVIKLPYQQQFILVPIIGGQGLLTIVMEDSFVFSVQIELSSLDFPLDLLLLLIFLVNDTINMCTNSRQTIASNSYKFFFFHFCYFLLNLITLTLSIPYQM